MAKDKVKKTVTMSVFKECKASVRFQAEGPEADTVMQNCYLQNVTWEALGKPKKVKVTVEAAG